MAAGVLVAITIIVAVFASGVVFPGFENNPTLGSKTGRLTVLLMDAPVELDQLWITITDLEVHQVGEGENKGGWINLIEDDSVEFDLLEYQDGKTLNLASVEIDPGTYNKIRMYVSEAEAFYSGEKTGVSLRVPPGKIDVITEFELFAGGNKVVLIDMEPDWVAISKSNNLRPVLKATISEQNPPIADFTYDPGDPTTEDEITFDASDSTDIDGTITSYSWDLGDGSEIQTGVEITYTFTSAAEHEVTLTVTDNDELTDTISKTITVQNPSPPP
jgi:PKD repeat protein